MDQQKPVDPNAPLVAFQQRLDDEGQFDDRLRQRHLRSMTDIDLPRGAERLGHLPGLDAQEGSTDE